MTIIAFDLSTKKITTMPGLASLEATVTGRASSEGLSSVTGIARNAGLIRGVGSSVGVSTAAAFYPHSVGASSGAASVTGISPFLIAFSAGTATAAATSAIIFSARGSSSGVAVASGRTRQAVGAAAASSSATATGAATLSGAAAQLISAARTDLLEDSLYVLAGAATVPMLSGTVAAGTWKSKRIALETLVGFGWLRVNASFSSGVVARLYGDGDLFYTTPSITSRDPVRLPPGRFRRWEFEIESEDRVTSVVLANTTKELV